MGGVRGWFAVFFGIQNTHRQTVPVRPVNLVVTDVFFLFPSQELSSSISEVYRYTLEVYSCVGLEQSTRDSQEPVYPECVYRAPCVGPGPGPGGVGAKAGEVYSKSSSTALQKASEAAGAPVPPALASARADATRHPTPAARVQAAVFYPPCPRPGNAVFPAPRLALAASRALSRQADTSCSHLCIFR